MKRTEFLKEIRAYAKASGQTITEVEGANHTKVQVGGKRTVVARHNEINDLTARAIGKQLGMPHVGTRKKGKQ